MAKRSRAAQTAFGPMVIVAVEQYFPPSQRLVQDDLAARFLPPAWKLMAPVSHWGSLRNLFVKASEKRAPGVWGGVLCRKRYADDRVTDAVKQGIGQVVMLGAGLDTRAYRLVVPAGVPAFEIDLPANIEYKQARLLAIYGQVPERVALIPLDFQTDDLAAALSARGFEIHKPAMFVWEAVTQYLTEDSVRKTLLYLSNAATGSRLIFTYVRQDFLDGTNLYGTEGLYRDFVVTDRVWRFGIDPLKVDDLLRQYGWVEREQVGRAEYCSRYIAPRGRELSVTDIERFVYAEKL
jgi:methyltransferase (TIGR00027 family)